jgi:hypothetical protein
MRLLVGKEWYDPLASEALLETEYERLIGQASADLFPGFAWIDLKIPVDSPHGTAKPDFALVQSNYREWWVGEAELAHHSLMRHVVPQVQRLATATYDEAVAAKMLIASPELGSLKLQRMMKGAQPRVLIIVNQQRPDWHIEVSPWGAQIATVEVFRSRRNRHALVVTGELPSDAGAVLSVCRVDPYLKNMLQVDSPAALPEARSGSLLIRFRGRVSDWAVLEVADRVWLKPRGPAPAFDLTRDILLSTTDSGELEFLRGPRKVVRVRL